jgi:epoxyqueuosine reductase
MERQWAAKSGLGWIGKNSLLINKTQGSFFFLAEMIIDLELEYDGPVKDYCGTCTKCIDACPTDAILDDGIVDASKCISYLTIELKESIPEEFRGKYEDWVFGCDICQDMCPWNRFSKKHNEPAFTKTKGVKSVMNEDWEEFTEEVFRQLLKGSPIKRTKYTGLKRNIDFVNKKPC